MRAALRAARAEKLREENELKRRQKEEQLKAERNEQLRREDLMRQLEMERLQREEARRSVAVLYSRTFLYYYFDISKISYLIM
jgi:hypothetical protein